MSENPHNSSPNPPDTGSPRPGPVPKAKRLLAPIPPLQLPPPLPGALREMGEEKLRWRCLTLAEELQAGPLAPWLPEDADEFSDLAAELAELVVSGLAPGRKARAVLAYARITGRHGPLSLSPAARAAWLQAWARQLQRARLPHATQRQLWQWMARLIAPWVRHEGDALVLPWPGARPRGRP